MARAATQDVHRFFFHEITPGDRRKFEARSNDSTTGGGARDLRFPNDAFGPLMQRMFPHATGRTTRNDGQITEGGLRWIDETGAEQMDNVEYWPPTDARPTEGRLARIHEIVGLRERLPAPGEDRVFLILAQDSNDRVFAEFVRESELHDPAFERAVADPILDCIAAVSHRKNAHVQGSVDFIAHRQYCHGG